MREGMVVDDDFQDGAVLARVFQAIAPGAFFDQHASWSSLGLDSLKRLHFMLEFERLTRRRLSTDFFMDDRSPSDLIDLSFRAPRERGQAAGTRPLVFLFPGIAGDDQALARFRHAMSPWIDCLTLELADLSQPASVLGDMGATARRLALRVDKAQPRGPLLLAGYSFGGFLAQQTALALQERGREIGLLCLLDTLTASPTVLAKEAVPAPKPLSLVSQVLPRPGDTLADFADRLAYGLLRKLRAWRLARSLVLAGWPRYSATTAQVRRAELLRAFRLRAIGSWRAVPIQARTLLAISDVGRALDCEATWRTLCPNLAVVSVGGDHLDLFEDGPLSRLKPALLKALAAVTAID